MPQQGYTVLETFQDDYTGKVSIGLTSIAYAPLWVVRLLTC